MYPIISYDEIISTLSTRLSITDNKGNRPTIKMVGILFSPPGAPLAKKEIIDNIALFHVRSGKHIDFFCAGYGPDDPNDEHRETQITVGGEGWYFNPVHFDSVRRELQDRTNWEYSGETELILTNAKYDDAKYEAYLEFNSMVVCHLEKMIRIGAIESVLVFFEKIFKYAESASGDDPTWGFSDKMGAQSIAQALVRFVLSLLPKNLGKDLRKVAVFAVRPGSVAT